MQDRHFALVRFIIVVGVCAGGPAYAGNFQVSPVLVALDADKKSALIEIANHGDDVIRLQVKAHAWDQGQHGEMRLSPTHDIVVFPTMLVLKPGEKKNVRIGARGGDAKAEQSFRVFVEELPPLPGAKRPDGVQVLMRMGIPIFVGGKSEKPRIEVAAAHAGDGGSLSFDVKNVGAAHAVTRVVDATLLDAQGNTVASQSFAGWYLLAGGERVYDGRFGDAACNAARLAVHVETAARESFSTSTPVDHAGCGR